MSGRRTLAASTMRGFTTWPASATNGSRSLTRTLLIEIKQTDLDKLILL